MIKTPLIAAVIVALPTVAVAAPSARDTLTQTAFASRDKTVALAQIAAAQAQAEAVLAAKPGDREALMTRAMATSYRAKLTKNRGDALAAKTQFEALARSFPRDAEAQAAVGAWHLNAVISLGGIMARGVLGARQSTGIEATDRAITLGGDRALFPTLAALLRLALDPKDARATDLLAAGAAGSTPTALDRIMQRRAGEMAAVLKGGDVKLIQALAKRLLPLGQFKE